MACILISFREQIFDEFKLDFMASYLSTPHLALDILLKTSRSSFSLITHREMYGLIEKNLRGGYVSVSQRYAAVSDPLREAIIYAGMEKEI